MGTASSPLRRSWRPYFSSSSMSRQRLPVTHSSDYSTARALTSLKHAPRFWKIFTTRVLRFISWLRHSRPLVVRMRLRWDSGKARQERHRSICPSMCSANLGWPPVPSWGRYDLHAYRVFLKALGRPPFFLRLNGAVAVAGCLSRQAMSF
jgi:hypothetical protein